MRSNAEYTRAVSLVGDGLNDCQIARATGIPRSTIRDWRRTRQGRRETAWHPPCAVCGQPEHAFRALPRASYSYLLGMYLGDGSIARMPRTWRLRIALDLAWPGIIGECVSSMQAVFPNNRVLSYRPDPEQSPSSRLGLLDAASLPLSSARPRSEASPPDQAGGVASRARPRAARGVHPWPDPVRRMPVYQPGQGGRQGLRIPALQLHERLRGHPNSLHVHVRPSGHRMATDEREEHLDCETRVS
jgi:hypothetical protein